MKNDLTPGVIHALQGNLAWQEMENRIIHLMKIAHDKTFDDMNEKAAGAFKAYELVLRLPTQLLEEAEKGKGVVTKLGRRLRGRSD